MDINEQGRLSTITIKDKFKQRNTQRLYWCCAFHSHSRVFNNDQNSYPKMSEKRSLICSWAVFVTSAGQHNICIFVAVLFMNVKYYIIKPACSFYFLDWRNYLSCYMKRLMILLTYYLLLCGTFLYVNEKKKKKIYKIVSMYSTV